MNLTPTGWCIFIGIVASAILLTIFSRKILGRVMVAKARILYGVSMGRNAENWRKVICHYILHSFLILRLF